MDESLSWLQIYLWPALFAFAAWAGTTVGLFLLNTCPLRVVRLALIPSTLLLAAALYWLWLWRHDLGVAGQYSAFLAGLLLYTWQEQLFYSGLVTGSYRGLCPAALNTRQRLNLALATHNHHEIAMVLGGIGLWVFFQDARSPLALATYGMLWAMMRTAKLNVLLGVRYLPTRLLPEHLAYLGSFWLPARGNSFFWPSLLIAAGLASWLWWSATGAAPAPAAVGYTLLATLMTLGVIELGLLLLPGPKVMPAAEPAAASAEAVREIGY